LLVLLAFLMAGALSARAFDVRREAPLQRPLFSGASAKNYKWGLAWQFELRVMSAPGGISAGFGMEGLVRVHQDFWLAPALSYLPGGAVAAHRGPDRHTQAVLGTELRLHGRAYLARWEKGAFYVSGGPTVAFFHGDRGPSNIAQSTWVVGPAVLPGVEWGRRVRFALESGVTLYASFNRGDAGWLEVSRPNGLIGYHVTLARISVRWYS
jgi:hypothetical protein